MDTKLLVSFLCSVSNIFLGAFIWYKNKYNLANVYYFLTCLSGGLWGISLVLLLICDNLLLANLLLKITVSFSILAALFFLLFALTYSTHVSYLRIKILFLTFLPITAIILIWLDLFSVENIIVENSKIIQSINKLDFIIYSMFFILYILLGLMVLYRKYVISSGINKVGILRLFRINVLTFTLTIFICLLMPIFYSFDLDWFGPWILFFNLFFIGRILFVKK